MAVIGFIGLGVMGRDMALHLVRAGHQVRAHDVRPDAAEALAAEGAVAAASVAEAARGADLVILMLPDTPQVEEVLLGPDGLAAHPPQGRLLVDMSTISPTATRRLAATMADAGVTMLDAPVSGGPLGAKNATLSIMVGGDAAALERARPILEIMGKPVHVGAVGAGQTVKACNQLVVAMNLQAVAEALALGRAAGLDLATLRDVLLDGAASSWMLQNLAPLMLAKDDRAGFRIDLMLKDLRLAGEVGFELGVPLPGLALATSLYLEARAHGEGGNGNQAIFRVYDRLSGQVERAAS